MTEMDKILNAYRGGKKKNNKLHGLHSILIHPSLLIYELIGNRMK
jgi:hypothetical protein